ncbi:MAG TPA: tripartite tricarboxylate transporter TctB family protein [Burkholderiales bacterium]|nr:tripartite tricarboxylate transporter TctB family protein [Burkholderiales bacterium]
MADHPDNEKQAGGVVSQRSMNIALALMLMAVALVVMIASYRLGAGWAKNVGPDSGYFPFYVALIMFAASAGTLVQQLLLRPPGGGRVFVTRGELMMVLQVLLPTAVFVVLSIYIGIYISMALFIAFFMMWHGHYPAYKAIPFAIAVPVVLFVVFEIWFLVPLPKGPFEAWLGY